MANADFAEVMVGKVKVLLRQTDAYGDQVSVFAIMLAGHGHQKAGEAHCAHLAEHMVFRNPTVKRIALIDWVGGVGDVTQGIWTLCNGWTGHDYTQYELTVPGQHLPEAIKRLVQGLFPGNINSTAYYNEVYTNVRRELNYMTSHQLAAPYNAFQDHFFQGTPYCQQLFQVAVTDVAPSQVLEFMQREYSASRLIIVLVGNFDKDAALAALEESIAAVPEEPEPLVPVVNLKLPAIAHVKLAALQRPILMLGAGSSLAKQEDAPLLSALMNIALGRLASQPPPGLQTAESLRSVLRNSAVSGYLVGYELDLGTRQAQLQAQATMLTQVASEIFADLALAGPTEAEVAMLASDTSGSANLPENVPRTLIDAWLRGMEELPWRSAGPIRKMSQAELVSALREVAFRYEPSLQYSVMIVQPAAKFSPVVAIAAALSILAAVIILVLRRRRLIGDDA